ncbi:Beta-lactamase superfamily domain-containing protein [Madurella fahalii]|uniref:Beta-lactamase superfamily domain-containing protein n=1 Tax=Madurella fahalii TaxID=1157608 RepID=A0ABQ0GKZ8_9PEZI
MPQLILNPQKRIPLLKVQTHHTDPEPTLPISKSKTHPSQSSDIQTSPENQGSVFFVGTATTFISYHGIRILTDPNFLHAGDHVHLGPAVTATRLTDPAVPDLASLPPVDCILLSHYHEDHFDREVEAQLSRDIPIITTPHAKTCLTTRKSDDDAFRAVHGLDTWDEMVMRVAGGAGPGAPAVKVTATPGKHVPPGPLADVNELLGAVPPTNGWLVELGHATAAPGTSAGEGGDGGDGGGFETGYRIYISGDTLLVDELKEIPARLRGDRIDLMLIHLGGTTIPGPKLPLLMVTMDAEQGVQLMRLVDPDVTVPIHFDDYDVFMSPLEDFKKEVEAAGFGKRVVYLDRGEEYRFTVKKV